MSGRSGAGKSFTGDYLAEVCNFVHIDGDCCFHSKEPEQVQLTANLVKCFYSYWFEEKQAPEELWKPYYDFLFKLIHDVPAEKDLVVSHSAYRKEARDYLVESLGSDVVFILLDCPKEELLRRAKVRFAEYAKVQGKSPEQTFQEYYKAEYSDEKFEEVTANTYKGLEPIQEGEKQCFTLSVASRDGETFQGLHRLLSLPAAPKLDEIPFEKIAQINYSRFTKK